ncbi:MAG TPA: dihydroorotate dehydrogenase-like protein [Opitutaceae bacterium]|jgi:dihydroorotate dehydrogenase (fumarate)|nr:dihydroorotate dehydrogenase-like protein [Opitutaceae bacterium]
MNISTSYLGLNLRSPVIVGASPLADTVDSAHRLQDAGCGAIVMRSLFEEQIYLSDLPSTAEYQLSPDEYLRQLADLKQALQVPIIASLNGCRPGGWIDIARRFENAGADAIELNFYQLASDPVRSAADVESELLETLGLVRTSVKLPIAVKLSPYYTSLANLLAEMRDVGAAGFVLFNRLYQPEFSSQGETQQTVRLSDSGELQSRLRWAALLSPGLQASLALSGGIGGAQDIIKCLLAGADAVQVVSALLKSGARYINTLNDGLRHWMGEQGHRQIEDFKGLMAVSGDLNPSDAERSSYQRMLQLWRV